MAVINATLRPLLWAVRQNGQVIETGLTEVGALTITGLEIISAADENEFLGAVVASAGSYRPLPDDGWLNAGEMYGYGGGLVIVRQSHNRTSHAPADIPALFTVYRANQSDELEWIAGEQVYVGTRRTYGGKVYEALQAHQTQPDWTPTAPGILNVLWREVVATPPVSAWAVGVAYKVADRVAHSGRLYECIQAHTSIASWSPTSPGILNVLWRDVGAAP